MAAAAPRNYIRARSYAFTSDGTPVFFVKPYKNSELLTATYRDALFVDEQVVSPALRAGLPSLQAAPQGIYVWMMLKNDAMDQSNFYALRVRSNQELGTLHHNMLSYLLAMGQELDFYASGEMMIYHPTRKVLFNMESSVFLERVLQPLSIRNNMKRKLPKNNQFNLERQKQIQEERAAVVSNRIRGILPEYDVSFHMRKPFIDKHKFLTHPSVIQLYDEALTQVIPFDPTARKNHAAIDPDKLFIAQNFPNHTELPQYNAFYQSLEGDQKEEADMPWKVTAVVPSTRVGNGSAGTGTFKPRTKKPAATRRGGGGKRDRVHKMKTRRNNRKK
jgi:hypothetical protein